MPSYAVAFYASPYLFSVGPFKSKRKAFDWAVEFCGLSKELWSYSVSKLADKPMTPEAFFKKFKK